MFVGRAFQRKGTSAPTLQCEETGVQEGHWYGQSGVSEGKRSSKTESWGMGTQRSWLGFEFRFREIRNQGKVVSRMVEICIDGSSFGEWTWGGRMRSRETS